MIAAQALERRTAEQEKEIAQLKGAARGAGGAGACEGSATVDAAF
jgi:hypothetical protein